MDLNEENYYQLVRQEDVAPEALQVFSDWMQEKGDPRGEMIALELALESGERKDTAVMSSRLGLLQSQKASPDPMHLYRLSDQTDSG